MPMYLGERQRESQMPLDADKLRKLRESRGWSQEQMAAAAGISVRTVQRAEKNGAASRETKVCLAAALEIPHGDLDVLERPIPVAARPTPVLNLSERQMVCFLIVGIGTAIGKFLQSAATDGISAEVLFRLAFVSGVVYVIYAWLRKVVPSSNPPP